MKLVPANGSRALLARILEQPELVAKVRSLEPRALGRLIDHVGLEDAGEIVALATAAQLLGVFDEDLWSSDEVGAAERLDTGRFVTWLEVLAEAGERALCEKLVELPEELVAGALAERLLVLDLDALALSELTARPRDIDLTDKALQSCLSLELDDYLVIALEHEGWDVIVTLLAELNERHHDELRRILDRLAAVATGRIDDEGGLYEVLSAAETLAVDVAAEREDRRAREGHVAPTDATAFLRLTRAASLEELRAATAPDPVTRAYFRQYAPELPAVGAPRDLSALFEGAGLDEPAAAQLPVAGATGEQLRPALLALQERDPARHAERLAELAYVANVLVAGDPIDGRRYRPAEAADAALRFADAGLAHLLVAAPTVGAPADRAARIVETESAVKLFRIGYRKLTPG